MIIQGSNIPIRIELEDFEGFPENRDISVSLQIPGRELKHWSAEDLIFDEYDERLIEAPITQEESMLWEPGPCKIEVKWVDLYGATMFAISRDYIKHWCDDTVMREEF